MIKGKNPEEIRSTFGIANDFTPEEEAKVGVSMNWLCRSVRRTDGLWRNRSVHCIVCCLFVHHHKLNIIMTMESFASSSVVRMAVDTV